MHALCFRGNQRGSEGYEEHIAGVGLLSSTIKEYKRTLGGSTKFLLHNVLWANENGLVDFYAKRVRGWVLGRGRGKATGMASAATLIFCLVVGLALQNMPEKANEFRGLIKAIDVWNRDTFNSLEDHPFILVDVNHVSDKLKHLIRPDNVHYEAPMYNIAMMLDLNIILRDTNMCKEF